MGDTKARDTARAKGTALNTRAGKNLKNQINSMRFKEKIINDRIWRLARRALYKDKSGEEAVSVLINAASETAGGLDADRIRQLGAVLDDARLERAIEASILKLNPGVVGESKRRSRKITNKILESLVRADLHKA